MGSSPMLVDSLPSRGVTSKLEVKFLVTPHFLFAFIRSSLAKTNLPVDCQELVVFGSMLRGRRSLSREKESFVGIKNC